MVFCGADHHQLKQVAMMSLLKQAGKLPMGDRAPTHDFLLAISFCAIHNHPRSAWPLLYPITTMICPLRSLLSLASILALAAGPLAAADPKLDEHLAGFAPFIGKTWRGEFKNSTKEKPQFDVSRWEVALKGKAVRVVHSVNDGVYGGESLVMWDPAKKTLATFYFTTAGFFTEGTIEFKDGKMIAREIVRGQQPGVSEVESITEISDGQMRVKARFLKNGQWTDGHEITYVEAPGAKVVVD
jgi:hypothetical protein